MRVEKPEYYKNLKEKLICPLKTLSCLISRVIYKNLI